MFDHLGLGVSDHAAGKAFFLEVLTNGAPGLRPMHHPNCHGAFVIGLDGHNVEAVCQRPEA